VRARISVLLVDLVAVLAFVTLGRRSHDEGSALVGTVTTAWPFVAGALVGEAVVAAVRKDPRELRSGAIVVAGCLLVGLPLRRLAGDGTPVPFIVVTTTVLTVFVLGWRVALRLSARRRRPAPVR
jgi:peptidoglycan/LPS O-acetylase OafA/YrhL